MGQTTHSASPRSEYNVDLWIVGYSRVIRPHSATLFDNARETRPDRLSTRFIGSAAGPQDHIMRKKTFPLKQAKAIGEQLGIRWDTFDLNQFRDGLSVELEHGTANQMTDVTSDDPLMTGKIALAHLSEFPDYYTRLAKMEEEATRFWNSKKHE